MEYFDIIAIMLLIIVISVVIGLNIVNVVSNKLTDIQINIPPLPKPNIVVNINKKDDKYNVLVNGEENNLMSNIENFGNIKSENQITEENNNIYNNDVDYCRYICENKFKNNYKVYRAFPSNSNKTGLKGYNISNFSSSASLDDIGDINLNNNSKTIKRKI